MFSKELEQSIANLFDQAQDKNLEYLTIEHLLLMLISDYEVRQALETNDVNLATLRENLEEHVRDNTPAKVDLKKPVQPTLGFQRVLQRAVFHVQSSGKGVVKPINLLVAIFSEKDFNIAVLNNVICLENKVQLEERYSVTTKRNTLSLIDFIHEKSL